MAQMRSIKYEDCYSPEGFPLNEEKIIEDSTLLTPRTKMDTTNAWSSSLVLSNSSIM